jgi:regulatory protein
MDILSAIYRYCNYQERCHKEVRNKLYELGCTTLEVEDNIAILIENGLLNEQRYADVIVRGKFRMNSWGRNKIVQHLRMDQVSTSCITSALNGLDSQEYYRTLIRLTEKKMTELRSEKSKALMMHKIFRYLLQKGYEPTLIKEALEEISNKTA